MIMIYPRAVTSFVVKLAILHTRARSMQEIGNDHKISDCDVVNHFLEEQWPVALDAGSARGNAGKTISAIR